MTPDTLATILPLAIPSLLGLVIPILVNGLTQWHAMPDWLQSILYALLSSLAAVIPTVTFDATIQDYFIALGIAWMVSMRADYTGIPQKLVAKREYVGRHRRRVDRSPPVD